MHEATTAVPAHDRPWRARRPFWLGIEPTGVARRLTALSHGAHTSSPREPYPPGYGSDIKAPWPQPSPIDPEGLAAAVLHVPPEEHAEFLATVVSRYVRTLWLGAPAAAAAAAASRGLDPVSDEEFASICFDSAFCRFLRPFDPTDRDLFAAASPPPGEDLLTLDTRALEGVEALPGIHVTPTVTLFSRGERGVAPLAIRAGDRVLSPGDGDAWELAKYCALQNNAQQLLFVAHPRVHFPFDAVNAVSKGALPRGHRLRCLLEPHLGIQLPLDYAVLYLTRSVAHNNQREIYTPFPHTRRGFFAQVRAGYAGVSGNPAFPPYAFTLGAPRIGFAYGDFLRVAYDAIHAFVDEALAGLDPRDRHVARWADGVAAWVPGFPDAAAVASRATLAATVATILHNVSVLHTADHHSLWIQSIRKVPLRLRVPLPRSAQGFVLDRKILVTRQDVFRHHLAREMYMRPHPVTPLASVAYAPGACVGSDLLRRFHASLHALDRPEWQRYAPLSSIGSSIQF